MSCWFLSLAAQSACLPPSPEHLPRKQIQPCHSLFRTTQGLPSPYSDSPSPSGLPSLSSCPSLTTLGTHLPQGLGSGVPSGFPALAYPWPHPRACPNVPCPEWVSGQWRWGPAAATTHNPRLPGGPAAEGAFPTHSVRRWGGAHTAPLGAWGPTWRATEALLSHEDTVVPSGRRWDPPPQDCLLVLKCSAGRPPSPAQGHRTAHWFLNASAGRSPSPRSGSQG